MPDGMTEGGDPPYLITPSTGDKWAWIEVDWDMSGGTPAVTGRSINTGPTVPNDDDSTQYIALTDFSITDGVLSIGREEGIGSQEVAACAGGFDAWQQ